jgi:hypothetical protein
MSSLPQTSENDPNEKRQFHEALRAEDGSVSNESGSKEEDPWWRTFKLWKVEMRGLKDDEPS